MRVRRQQILRAAASSTHSFEPTPNGAAHFCVRPHRNAHLRSFDKRN
jgi:hypothetical protein